MDTSPIEAVASCADNLETVSELLSALPADYSAAFILVQHLNAGRVLSGAGSEGALGIRAIKQRGGTTFAQYPGSARFSSMPISAIETGCVGFVLRRMRSPAS